MVMGTRCGRSSISNTRPSCEQRRRLLLRTVLQQYPPEDHLGFFVSGEVDHAAVPGWWCPAIPLPFVGEGSRRCYDLISTPQEFRGRMNAPKYADMPAGSTRTSVA